MTLSYFIVGCLLYVSPAVALTKWYRNDYPNPRIDIKLCGRNGNVSYVCDPQNLLSRVEANQLDNLIESVMDNTKCPCAQDKCDKNARGYKIGIAIVEKMITDAEVQNKLVKDEYKYGESLDEAQKFSYNLLTRWSLGECEEDIILFYSKFDQVVYTMTGDVTQILLPPVLVAEISAEHRVKFADAKYFDGFRNIINDYRSVLRGEYKRKSAVAQSPRYLAVVGNTSSVIPASLLMSMIMAFFTALLH